MEYVLKGFPEAQSSPTSDPHEKCRTHALQISIKHCNVKCAMQKKSGFRDATSRVLKSAILKFGQSQQANSYDSVDDHVQVMAGPPHCCKSGSEVCGLYCQNYKKIYGPSLVYCLYCNCSLQSKSAFCKKTHSTWTTRGIE